MQDASASVANNTDHRRKPLNGSDNEIALQLRYRQIGISAVAAAARYQGNAKNPAYAPAAVRADDGAATT